MAIKIFEKIGKATLYKYFFHGFACFLLFSSLSLFVFFFSKERTLAEQASRLSSLCEKRNETLQKRIYKKDFLAQYQAFDPFFLEKNLETLFLLKKESQEIESHLRHPAFFSQEDLRCRLEFLQGNQNRIKFKEDAFRHSPLFDEVELSLTHPVEINKDDLATILSNIEGVKIQKNLLPPGRPQLIIRKMELEKKKETQETLLLNLQLVKREYLKRSVP